MILTFFASYLVQIALKYRYQGDEFSIIVVSPE
jgi:hypothetical protein